MANVKGKAKLKDILLLYDGKDSTNWKDFILDCLNACPQELQIEGKDLDAKTTNIGATVKQFSMVLILTSTEMLNTLESQSSILEPSFRSHSCVSVIKLFITQNSYEAKLGKTYKSSKDWKLWSIGADDTEDQVQQVISEIIDKLQTLAAPPEVLPPPPAARTGRIHSICPDCIRQGGETVVMILRKEISEGQCVQVMIGNDSPMIDTETLNPFCFRFKAPAHKAGPAHLRLFIDGKKIAKMTIHYSSMLKFAYTCPEYLCQIIGLKPDDQAGLDKELTNIFRSSTPEDGSLQYLLTPKNLLATSSVSGGTESCGELPTLLHFACKYGLNDLAASIVETPGSRLAVEMDNERGLNPIDLAKEEKHEDLVNYLESLLDMHDYVTDIEDIYEKMSGGKSLDSYMNQESAATGSRYLRMTGDGRDSVQEAYIACRLPIESDYEITTGASDLVEEVSPIEDVSERAPPVPVRIPSVGRHQAPPSSTTAPPRPDSIDVPKRVTWGTMAVPKEDLFAEPEKSPLSPHSLGSTSLEELNEYVDAYKKGEFNLDDIERLYRAWNERNRDTMTLSMKERKKQLDEFKNTYQSVLSTQKKKKRKTFFSKKKEVPPELNIQNGDYGLCNHCRSRSACTSMHSDQALHRLPLSQRSILTASSKRRRSFPTVEVHNKHHVDAVQANKYEKWSIMQGTHTLPRSYRDSMISNASTSSSSSSGSCGSRDSALGPVQEMSTDSEEEEVPPEVPQRRVSKSEANPEKQHNRKSWGEDFLQSMKNRPGSRLPRPPVPALVTRASRLTSTPEVPPRPTPPQTRKISK